MRGEVISLAKIKKTKTKNSSFLLVVWCFPSFVQHKEPLLFHGKQSGLGRWVHHTNADKTKTKLSSPPSSLSLTLPHNLIHRAASITRRMHRPDSSLHQRRRVGRAYHRRAAAAAGRGHAAAVRAHTLVQRQRGCG